MAVLQQQNCYLAPGNSPIAPTHSADPVAYLQLLTPTAAMPVPDSVKQYYREATHLHCLLCMKVQMAPRVLWQTYNISNSVLAIKNRGVVISVFALHDSIRNNIR